MKTQDEKTKGAIAGVIIVASLFLFVIRMKRIIYPSAPAPANPAAAAAPAPNLTASAPSPASGGSVAPAAVDVLPPNAPKTLGKDPFGLTSAYKSRIPNPNAARAPMKGPAGFKLAKATPFPAFSFGKSGAPNLPPAAVNPFPVDSLPGSGRGPIDRGMIASADPGAPSLPAPASQPAVPVAPPAPEFALTGTVDGDIPMAILRANNRNYLVHVGDWLENSLQVRQITPRMVELKDRTGRSKILKLGVTVNAT